MAAPVRARPRRTWPQRLLITFNVLSIFSALGVAGALSLTYTKASQLQRVQLGRVLTVQPAREGEPQNYLIIGTDDAEGLDPDDPVLIGRPPGIRSDVIMILRIDPEAETAKLLSLPRDLWLPIADTRSSQRINSAIVGGADRLVETVQDYFNIPINSYVELNFSAFHDLVRTIDGVPMYFAQPVRDRKSGLNVPEAGCITLDATQALAFARSRAFEYFEDGRWHVDPSGDLGRISRQQLFIRQALHRAFVKGARNPIVLESLIDSALDTVTVDDLLSYEDLFGLADRFRNFNPETLETYSLPVYDDVTAGAAILRMSVEDAQPVLDVFRGGDPDEVDTDSVILLVRNGTGEPGEALRAATDFESAGFTVPAGNIGDAFEFDHDRTLVEYLEGDEAKADLVARYLVNEPIVLEVLYIVGSDVVVTTGADFEGVLDEPRDGSAGTTTTTRPGDEPDETTTTTESTTTTVVGVVPGPPPGNIAC